MKKNIKGLIVTYSIAILIITSINTISTSNEKGKFIIQEPPTTTIGSQYKGYLRIYIAEIESRWDMENGVPYRYAFYDFAFNDYIEIPYQETYHDTLSWEGDIDLDNIMILAAIYNIDENKNYADPPLGNPFVAYYVDAAAGVLPGETDESVKNEDYTHTIFCEIGTASWCPSCPGMAKEIKKVYDSGDYPFYFIEMVTDMSNKANTRMFDYSLKWLPTGFYDGGFQVVIGGEFDSSGHKTIIKNCGKRDVHDLDFVLYAETDGENGVSIEISITNNEELPNAAPNNPTIKGPSEGKPGEIYEYEIQTTDPEGDNVLYFIDWADGYESEWIGPYLSGGKIIESRSWIEEGTYIVRVKAKDLEGLESDWTWLKVSVSKSKSYNFPILKWIFARFFILE